jgi:tRNA-uridine 2-sulfurtransferase
MKSKPKIKILVAMSGGVDSSVAAALLKKQEFEVQGIYLRMADKRELKRKIASMDEKSAREVAKKLGIKFKVVDARKAFKKTVANYFLREYKSGRTPNPCAICNPKIKLAEILKLADKSGIDYVATGHYARLRRKFPISNFSRRIGTPPRRWQFPNKLQTTNYKLQTASDKTKDQSYFLYGLSQEQLARIIFPLGDYKKTEVKNMAKKMNLPVFDRKESHDVCFISGKAEDYMRKNIKLRKGKIVDQKGKVLGQHQGLPLYTIGQRKGIELGGTGPYYVARKDMIKNSLMVVSKSDNPKLFQKSMLVGKVNWIANNLKFPLSANVRIRYGHLAVYAIIKSNKKADEREYSVIFKEPQRAITPGQSAVFYGKDGEVLGGGTIKK